MSNPIVAGNQNPLAPDTLGLPVVNIPGMQLPTTSEIINNIPQSGVAKPGHFSQITVDGPSAFNGAVYFGASQRTAWFDCSPATVDPTVVLDFASGPQQYLFLTRDTIVWLPTTDQQEGMFYLLIEQDAAGAHALTWKINNPITDGSAVVLWLAGSLPVMSSAAHSVRLYTFTWCQNLNGGVGAYIGASTTAFPTSLPASDVSAWAKAGTKPSYTADDVFAVSRNRGSVWDFNTALTDGEYLVGSGSSVPNAPYTGNVFAKLRVLVSDGGTHDNASNWIWQYLDDTSGRAYYRYKVNSNAWSVWQRITIDAVAGPPSATDNAIVRFDAATGKLVQNSPVIIDDAGNVGIGTPTPHSVLDLGGAAGNKIAIYNNAGGSDFYGIGMDGAGKLQFKAGAAQATIPGMTLDYQGSLWVANDCSALSFTDRTPIYEGDALAELIKIKGIDGKIDHSTLPAFARHVTKLQVASETEKDADGKAIMVETQEEGRDLGAMISMLTVAIKQLNTRLLAVEKR